MNWIIIMEHQRARNRISQIIFKVLVCRYVGGIAGFKIVKIPTALGGMAQPIVTIHPYIWNC